MAENVLGAPLPVPLPGVSRALHKELELADSFNRLAMQVLKRATPGKEPTLENNQSLIAATLFARSYTSFQSALVLIGRGAVADARTIVRSMAETAIVLNGAVDDPSVCDDLMKRHEVNRRKLLNAWMSDPQAMAVMTDEHKSKFALDVKQLPGTETKDPINIGTLASRVGLTWLYNTVYRMSSSDAAHASLDALEHHVEADAKGDIQRLSFGPRIEKLADTLVGAMNCMLVSVHAISMRFPMSELQLEMDQHLAALQKLSGGGSSGEGAVSS
jgi:hypothetical protein